MILLGTQTNEWVELLSTNSTDTSFTANAPTTTEPTGAGIVDLFRIAGKVHNNVAFIFYGTGNDDTTFDARVTGWQKVSTLWVPVPLLEVSCTLGTSVGVSGASVTDSERFADTVTVAAAYTGLANTAYRVVSPTGNLIAMLMIDMAGLPKLEVEFDRTGATACNALYRVL